MDELYAADVFCILFCMFYHSYSKCQLYVMLYFLSLYFLLCYLVMGHLFTLVG